MSARNLRGSEREELVELALDGGFGLRTGQSQVGLFAVFEEEDGGERHDAVFLTQIALLVEVVFADYHFPFVFLCQFVDHGA